MSPPLISVQELIPCLQGSHGSSVEWLRGGREWGLRGPKVTFAALQKNGKTHLVQVIDKGWVISRWSSQILHPRESCPALVPSCVYPTAGSHTAWQVVKKKEESHDGPGKGCQAVLPHPVASQLCAGMGSPRVGELGLLQRRNLSREQGIFSIQHLSIRKHEFFKAASLCQGGYVLTSLLIALVLLKYLCLEIFVKSRIDTSQRRMVGFLL